MEWHVTDAQNLATIDKEVGGFLALTHLDKGISQGEYRHFSPAEYEIVRRVIYATGDFEYKSLIEFSERALQASAAALASRSTVIVDDAKVQAGIAQKVRWTFANPVYCAVEAQTRPQKDKTVAAWGMETLAKRYPEGIFVIGQAPTALTTLLDLVKADQVRPVLVIVTPPHLINLDSIKENFKEFLIPNITIKSRKGGANVAAAILDALIDLSWEAYG